MAAAKRLKAPGMSSSRYHLDMMMIDMMIKVVVFMIMLVPSPRYHLGSIVMIVIKAMVMGRLV